MTEELLDELRNLACDVNEAEIRAHSVINLIQGPYNRHYRLNVNHEWLDAWHGEFNRILQAIAATLGVTGKVSEKDSDAGTCQMEYVSDFMSWHCKACDQMDMAPRNPKPRYCKWCGRKVVGE